MNAELLLSELFGDLMEEKETEETHQKSVKEAKARKAMPLFEIFA
jgi:hypothetical protein